MLALLRQPRFALLWFGGLISMAGNWMLRLALPVYVYEMTHSTLATGLMAACSLLPNLLLGSLAGVFVDRWDRKRTMVATNLLLAVTLLPLLLVRSADWLWLAYVVVALQATIVQFFYPAENALLPQLVAEEYLVTANSLNTLNNNLARLIGPAIGGLAAGLLGLGAVALLDALSFVIAALLISLIPVERRQLAPAAAARSAASSWRRLWLEWRQGLGLVRREPMVRTLFMVLAIAAIGEGVLSVLFIPWVTDVLHGEALQLGWLMSAQAIGGLLGGFVIAQLGRQLRAAQLAVPSLLLFGLIDLLLFNYALVLPIFAPALLLAVVVGLPAAGIGASLNTLLQSHVHDEYRGRVFGALHTTEALMMLIGIAFASTCGELLGVLPVINTQGLAYVLAGLIAWRGIRRCRQLAPAGSQAPAPLSQV